jgi:putative ABC transport system permease protein
LAGLVLLIACVNVANLLLARGASRDKEFAMRRALGAGKGRLARQLATESMLLSMMGGAAGLVAALGGMRLLERGMAEVVSVPFRNLEALRLDWRVFAFAFLLCVATGLLFGLVSAHGALTRDRLGAAFQVRGAQGQVRYGLTAVEVALTLAVLVGAGWMVASLATMLGVDPGLDPRNVLAFQMALPQKVLYTSAPDKPEFCRAVTERVGGVPGVVSAGAISHLPIGGGNAGRDFLIEGRPMPSGDDLPGAAYGVACPGFFATMKIPLVAGREFDERDTTGSTPVVMINEPLARKHFKGQNPVGARIRLTRTPGNNPWMTVVGVVKGFRHGGLDQEMGEHMYRPYPQAGWPNMTVVARTVGEPMALAAAIQGSMARFDADQGAGLAFTMERVVERSMGNRRLPALLLGCFAALALVLASVGIAGVTAYTVAERTQEIGVRMALGATAGQVLRLMMRRSLGWTLVGVALGVPASMVVIRLLRSMLLGIVDTSVTMAASLILVLVAALAAYIPARRAARIDPVAALRMD